MLTMRMIISEHPIPGIVLNSKGKTGPSFVGVMRLVARLSEGKER